MGGPEVTIPAAEAVVSMKRYLDIKGAMMAATPEEKEILAKVFQADVSQRTSPDAEDRKAWESFFKKDLLRQYGRSPILSKIMVEIPTKEFYKLPNREKGMSFMEAAKHFQAPQANPELAMESAEILAGFYTAASEVLSELINENPEQLKEEGTPDTYSRGLPDEFSINDSVRRVRKFDHNSLRGLNVPPSELLSLDPKF
jgi:hypothetical protein